MKMNSNQPNGLNPVTPEVTASLQLLGANLVSKSLSDRINHAKGETHFQPQPPDLVFYAESVEHVQAAIRICNEAKVPVIPYGTGTSVEGGIAAPFGGVCLDVSRMNRILRISQSDMDVTVEAGVTRKQLNTAIRDQGLFFPIDPGADASLGGMASTGASGTNAVRYGTMRNNVLGLTVVTSDGEIIKTGGRARKSSAGYDLTRLFCGAEGTLGIIADLTLRLYGIPEVVRVGTATFNSLEEASDNVIAMSAMGVNPSRVELLDEAQIVAINRYSRLGLREASTLFYEFHGSAGTVADQVARANDVVREFGGSDIQWAHSNDDCDRLWKARHDAYFAALALRTNCLGWSTDTCAPVSRLTELILAAKSDIATFQLTATIVGHVGDGNFHCIVVFDPADEHEHERVVEFNRRLVTRSIAAGGTCTGEHGIGLGKVEYLELEHPTGLPVMRKIKAALDPAGIMNPGKVIERVGPQSIGNDL